MYPEFEITPGGGEVEIVHVNDLMKKVSLEELDFVDMQALVAGIERKVDGLHKDGLTEEEIIEKIKEETRSFKPDVRELFTMEASRCLGYM